MMTYMRHRLVFDSSRPPPNTTRETRGLSNALNNRSMISGGVRMLLGSGLHPNQEPRAIRHKAHRAHRR